MAAPLRSTAPSCLRLALVAGLVGCSSGGGPLPGWVDAATPATADAATGADAAVSDGAVLADLRSDAASVSNDPFDPASCGGPAITSAQATALLGMAPRLKLADATLYRRTRTCTGQTVDTCGPFGAPVPHTQALLTYSGGVTTDYKTFSFPTHLILFPQGGQPRFSVRHESDYRHSATSDTRGVVFAFGKDPLENTYPVINVWDFAPAPNRYEDLAGRLGDKGLLSVAERCARVVFPTGLATEVAGLYRF